MEPDGRCSSRPPGELHGRDPSRSLDADDEASTARRPTSESGPPETGSGRPEEAGPRPVRRRRLAHRRQYTKSRRLASSYLRSQFVRYDSQHDEQELDNLLVRERPIRLAEEAGRRRNLVLADDEDEQPLAATRPRARIKPEPPAGPPATSRTPCDSHDDGSADDQATTCRRSQAHPQYQYHNRHHQFQQNHRQMGQQQQERPTRPLRASQQAAAWQLSAAANQSSSQEQEVHWQQLTTSGHQFHRRLIDEELRLADYSSSSLDSYSPADHHLSQPSQRGHQSWRDSALSRLKSPLAATTKSLVSLTNVGGGGGGGGGSTSGGESSDKCRQSAGSTAAKGQQSRGDPSGSKQQATSTTPPTTTTTNTTTTIAKGREPEEQRAFVRSETVDLNRIKWHSESPRLKFFPSSDFSLLSSTETEPLALVRVEAKSSGVPRVSPSVSSSLMRVSGPAGGPARAFVSLHRSVDQIANLEALRGDDSQQVSGAWLGFDSAVLLLRPLSSRYFGPLFAMPCATNQLSGSR